MECSCSPLSRCSACEELRSMIVVWSVAALLPLPVLVVTGPTGHTDIACFYLGLSNAWLVSEFHRNYGLPTSYTSWRARMRAVVIAVAVNVALFVLFGLAAGVKTNMPFPLMATLCAIPAVGMLPWMLRQMPKNPYAAIILSGFLVAMCKLVGCVVARFVYGPDYIAMGYVSADWRTAKLMISVLWALSVSLSLGCFVADFRRCMRGGC